MKTIVISRTDKLGDVVLTLPMAGIIKDKFPNSRVIFLGNEYTEPLISTSKDVDLFIDFKRIEKLPFLKQVEVFKDFHADAIIHVFPNSLVARLAFLANITKRIGTSHRMWHWLFCNKLVDLGRKNSELHEAQLNLKLLEGLGLNANFSTNEIKNFFHLSKIKPLQNDFKHLLSKDRFNLILHPKSNGSAREWGLEKYYHLINCLPKERYKIFITGTKAEGEEIHKFINHFDDDVIDLTGKMNLCDLISFIDAADGLVAASTGVMHIAAALGKFVLGIFVPLRPIFPTRWAPIGQNAHFLVAEQPCEGCSNDGECLCIKRISVQQVYKQLENAYIDKFIKLNAANQNNRFKWQ